MERNLKSMDALQQQFKAAREDLKRPRKALEELQNEVLQLDREFQEQQRQHDELYGQCKELEQDVRRLWRGVPSEEHSSSTQEEFLKKGKEKQRPEQPKTSPLDRLAALNQQDRLAGRKRKASSSAASHRPPSDLFRTPRATPSFRETVEESPYQAQIDRYHPDRSLPSEFRLPSP